ncbi:hypothetical protein Ppa06_60880 [Planomonospora parontospora subsp. parontospora]|uniref:Uncharacterized protein n=2 Tax=Planomonospora parontospora TaxID=58119 RepID=A0AA37F3X0_9ACTN|nr:hypothetical protein GCM10010126_21680 [Planomonospora parontospora]GII12290.1 hypothetical protein Ppa06_60880 [Planomonospora parontospora subsp. parontospora]
MCAEFIKAAARRAATRPAARQPFGRAAWAPVPDGAGLRAAHRTQRPPLSCNPPHRGRATAQPRADRTGRPYDSSSHSVAINAAPHTITRMSDPENMSYGFLALLSLGLLTLVTSGFIAFATG